VDEIAAFPGRVYVHCAVGRGRSALVVAAVLLQRGVVKTPDEAREFLQAKRSVVRLNAEQRHFLAQYYSQNIG
jgi:protein-tyrosine phosphatase